MERGAGEEQVSSLIVIAEEETEELEAQVRGSRSAWELRLLGVDALFKLLSVRESIDDDQIEDQIQSVLVPQEFTRLDKIIDLVFATKEDTETPMEIVENDDDADEQPKPPNTSFHDLVLPRLQVFLNRPLVRRARSCGLRRTIASLSHAKCRVDIPLHREQPSIGTGSSEQPGKSCLAFAFSKLFVPSRWVRLNRWSCFHSSSSRRIWMECSRPPMHREASYIGT
jgi:hypothetical protein